MKFNYHFTIFSSVQILSLVISFSSLKWWNRNGENKRLKVRMHKYIYINLTCDNIWPFHFPFFFYFRSFPLFLVFLLLCFTNGQSFIAFHHPLCLFYRTCFPLSLSERKSSETKRNQFQLNFSRLQFEPCFSCLHAVCFFAIECKFFLRFSSFCLSLGSWMKAEKWERTFCCSEVMVKE